MGPKKEKTCKEGGKMISGDDPDDSEARTMASDRSMGSRQDGNGSFNIMAAVS